MDGLGRPDVGSVSPASGAAGTSTSCRPPCVTSSSSSRDLDFSERSSTSRPSTPCLPDPSTCRAVASVHGPWRQAHAAHGLPPSPKFRLFRRVNVLLYLNPAWDGPGRRRAGPVRIRMAGSPRERPAPLRQLCDLRNGPSIGARRATAHRLSTTMLDRPLLLHGGSMLTCSVETGRPTGIRLRRGTSRISSSGRGRRRRRRRSRWPRPYPRRVPGRPAESLNLVSGSARALAVPAGAGTV